MSKMEVDDQFDWNFFMRDGPVGRGVGTVRSK
jgi:hypothetical protein